MKTIKKSKNYGVNDMNNLNQQKNVVIESVSRIDAMILNTKDLNSEEVKIAIRSQLAHITTAMNNIIIK